MTWTECERALWQLLSGLLSQEEEIALIKQEFELVDGQRDRHGRPLIEEKTARWLGAKVVAKGRDLEYPLEFREIRGFIHRAQDRIRAGDGEAELPALYARLLASHEETVFEAFR